ncbi:MAG: SARP family transcriptional regulator [Hamadaea sp.]|nr:SARP family transcriptional regulator [Hamadaea sp.]
MFDEVGVRLLGPVEITRGRAVYALPGRRRKAVLVALALSVGETVSTDLLLEVVWDGRPPATAANTLQSHVSFLRGRLGDRAAIVATTPGYRLRLGERAVDVGRLEGLLAAAGRAGDARDRAALLRRALGLWRDRPLSDLAGLAWFDQHASRLERLRTRARKAFADALLELGEYPSAVSHLEEFVAEQPFDEETHGQLMVALCRSGRAAEALLTYHRLRGLLADELGVEPGRALRGIFDAILRDDAPLWQPHRRL